MPHELEGDLPVALHPVVRLCMCFTALWKCKDIISTSSPVLHPVARLCMWFTALWKCKDSHSSSSPVLHPVARLCMWFTALWKRKDSLSTCGRKWKSAAARTLHPCKRGHHIIASQCTTLQCPAALLPQAGSTRRLRPKPDTLIQRIQYIVHMQNQNHALLRTLFSTHPTENNV